MRNILNRPVARESRRDALGARRTRLLAGAAGLAAAITLLPLAFSSHGKLISIASAFAQSGNMAQNEGQSTDDMSRGAEPGDDNGVDPAGHDAGDDNGVDAAVHDAGD